jgi:4-hydroxybenzoyl-CoA thioesterase
MKSILNVTVEFGDTDPAATVFYPNFFRWFDASTWRLFINAGLTLDVLKSDYGVIGHPVVDARSKFIKAVFFGDTIEITSSITNWKRKTFDVMHEVRNNGELYAEGMEVRCLLAPSDENPKRFHAIMIPDEIKRRLIKGNS